MKATKQSLVVSLLAVVAIGLMVASWWSPLWWVSLVAPNYPVDRFPDGIRIQFGYTGVSNGCITPPKTSRVAQETTQEDLGWRSDEGAMVKDKPTAESGLDCVHEMNTINHYVGMRPIGVGAPVERLLSRYILGMFGVMLLAFALGQSKLRLVVLGVGFTAVSAWMLVDLLPLGRLASFVTEYKLDAGKYFREAERIELWGENVTKVTIGISLGLVALMGFMVFASWKWKYFQLALALVPALLPAYFVAAYAAWLGWFGHNMHPWGAFTLKPFMPTVFGEGKVAQFSTNSYPHWGFALLAGMFVVLVVAAARRRFEIHEQHEEQKPEKPAQPTVTPAVPPTGTPATAGKVG